MNLSMMFYGDPGMGKTVLACSAIEVAEMQPILMLDLESNITSVKSKLNFIEAKDLGKKIVKDKIDRLAISSTNDIQTVLDYVLTNRNVYKTIIIDSLSEICSMALNEAAGEGKVRKSLLTVIPHQIQNYGYVTLLIKQVIDAFKQLDATIIYTSLEDIDKIEGELVMKVRPNFFGKLSREVMARIAIVGNLSIKIGGTSREVRFQPTNRIVAKDQSEDGKLGTTMENPTMKKIMEKING